MSETPGNKNGKGLDAAIARGLAEWPIAEKSALEWDEVANNIVARIDAGDVGRTKADISDEALFMKPSGQEDELRHNSTAQKGLESGASVDAAKSTAGAVAAKSPGELPMSMSSERERDRASLKDLAKLASMTPAPPSIRPSTPASGVHAAAAPIAGAARGDDSGLVDLKALSSPDAASQASPSSARMPIAPPSVPASSPSDARDSVSSMKAPVPLASQGLFDDEPSSLSEPPPAVSARSSAPPAIANAVASTPPRSIAPAPERSRSGVVIAIGAVVAFAAAAAVGVLFIRAQHATPTAMTVAPAAPAADTADMKSAVAGQPIAQADAPPENTLDPSMLPEAAKTPATKAWARNGAPAPSPKMNAKPDSKTGTPPPDLQAAMADTPPASPAPAQVAKDSMPKANDPTPQATPAGSATGALADAMRQAAGPTSSNNDNQTQQSAPTFAPGSVPQRPSQGAVTGALGAVLPDARACLGPDDPVSRATIAFASGGNVTTVNVHGAAAGKPAEGCIKAALMKARVPPFAESVYTATITVRH